MTSDPKNKDHIILSNFKVEENSALILMIGGEMDELWPLRFEPNIRRRLCKKK